MILFTKVYKEYKLDGEIFQALKNINLKIEEGEYAAIAGPSGCGKSTLMHLIGLLDTPSSGTINMLGKDISRQSDNELSRLRNEFVGFVFQQFNLINKLTVLENILLPTIYSHRKTEYKPVDRAMELLKRFDILQKAKSFPNKLSGGQQQRVAIARSLINNPKLILADEPTGNLDSRSGGIIMKLLHDLNINDKITVVIVTHDVEIAKSTRRQIRMFDGEIVR